MENKIYREYVTGLLPTVMLRFLEKRNSAWRQEYIDVLESPSDENVRRHLEAIYQAARFRPPVLVVGNRPNSCIKIAGVYPASTRDDFREDLELVIGDVLSLVSSNDGYLCYSPDDRSTHFYMDNKGEEGAAAGLEFKKEFFRKNKGFVLTVNELALRSSWEEALKLFEDE